MKIQEKLKKIIDSDYTQQKLANELGVSFATLNSWINKKSEPRQKHIQKINDFYEYIFGLDKISEDELSKKREKVLALEDKNLFKDILKNQEILDKLILKITYNTNSIEGSTLTEADTEEILNKKTLQNKTIVEHLEALNHKKAFLYSLELVKKNKITKEDVLEIHRILMAGIIENAGFFRNHQVRILGSGVTTANYFKVNELMDDFIKEINKKEKNRKNIVRNIAKYHAKFEQIHPFSDGNGRVGRLLMLIFAFKNNLPPVVILKERKKSYYKYLREAQLNESFDFLEDFILDSISMGGEIIKKRMKN